MKMPANRSQVERSASYLKCKFSSDMKLHEDYVAFLEGVISAGYQRMYPRMF